MNCSRKSRSSRPKGVSCLAKDEKMMAEEQARQVMKEEGLEYCRFFCSDFEKLRREFKDDLDGATYVEADFVAWVLMCLRDGDAFGEIANGSNHTDDFDVAYDMLGWMESYDEYMNGVECYIRDEFSRDYAK